MAANACPRKSAASWGFAGLLSRIFTRTPDARSEHEISASVVSIAAYGAGLRASEAARADGASLRDRPPDPAAHRQCAPLPYGTWMTYVARNTTTVATPPRSRHHHGRDITTVWSLLRDPVGLGTERDREPQCTRRRQDVGLTWLGRGTETGFAPLAGRLRGARKEIACARQPPSSPPLWRFRSSSLWPTRPPPTTPSSARARRPTSIPRAPRSRRPPSSMDRRAPTRSCSPAFRRRPGSPRARPPRCRPR